jgi:tetratricopeptide (TPR) repeat protein
MRATGDPTGGSAAILLGEIQRLNGDIDESRDTLAPFREAEGTVEPVLHARALMGIGMNLAYAGKLDEAGPLIERALMVLEDQQDWPALGNGLVGRGVFLAWCHRRQEGLAVCRHGLLLAEEHDLPAVALRARFNIAGLLIDEHRLEEGVAEVGAALSQARERGDRSWDTMLRGQALGPLVMLGRWDEAWRDGVPLLDADPNTAVVSAAFLAGVAAARGEDEVLERCRALSEPHFDSPHLDMRSSARLALAVVAMQSGDLQSTRGLAEETAEASPAGEISTEAFRVWSEVTLAGDDDAAIDRVAAWVEAQPPARRMPLFGASRARLRAEEAHRRGNADEAMAFEREAEETLRGVGARPLLASALLDRARRRGDEAALGEAREILQELGATRWLARVEGLPALS